MATHKDGDEITSEGGGSRAGNTDQNKKKKGLQWEKRTLPLESDQNERNAIDVSEKPTGIYEFVYEYRISYTS